MGWGVGGRWYRLAMEIPPAKRYHMKQRNPRKKPSVLKRKATTARRLHEVIPLADFALIRRFALNCLQFFFPTRGKASFGYIDAFESAFECGIAKEGSAVRPPSSVAGAPPSPSKGKASFGCANFFRSASQSYHSLTLKSALYQTITNRRSSLPLRGGRWRRRRRMRAGGRC